MKYYRAYFLNSEGQIFRFVELDCEDDTQAKDAAATLLDGSTIELWHMGRIVCRLEPDESSATDKPV